MVAAAEEGWVSVLYIFFSFSPRLLCTSLRQREEHSLALIFKRRPLEENLIYKRFSFCFFYDAAAFPDVKKLKQKQTNKSYTNDNEGTVYAVFSLPPTI